MQSTAAHWQARETKVEGMSETISHATELEN